MDHLKSKLAPLKKYQPKRVKLPGLKSSAVLVPIIPENDGTIIFTLRSAHLKHHAHQISFPGGRMEQGEHPWEAALREAEEEIGMLPSAVTHIGRIDDVISPRGYHIRCYVGLVSHFKPQINKHEVERLVKVPLNELFDSNRHSTKKWKGIRDVHYFDFDDGLVWGVTGLITWHLRQILINS